jgi:hypothetical protein
VNRTQALVALAGAILLLGTNSLQFFYGLNPRLKPDPGERLQATVRVLDVEKCVSIGEYLKRVTDPKELQPDIDSLVRSTLDDPRPSAQQIRRARTRVLSRQGIVIYADTTVEGLKRRKVELGSALYRARNRSRITEYDEGAITVRTLSSPTDHFVEIAFVDEPPESGDYFVRLELRTSDRKDGEHGKLGALLAITDSTRFHYAPGFPGSRPCR